jgi:NAD(P)-dependent dehydrogenase (short-subunit alcohol dehydrogenase family)
MPTTLITGANRGIGLALAREFTSRGHDVIATARDPGAADELKETGASVYRLDVAKADEIATLAAELQGQPIDVLLNNAGITGGRQPVGETDFDSFLETLVVNTIAPVRMLEAFTANVAAGELKRIVVITSQLGSIANADASWGMIYRTSKAAVNMAYRTAAVALAEKGITCLALHPGHVETDMGGAGAPVKPAESAKGLAGVILDTTPAGELRFLDYRGKTLPW